MSNLSIPRLELKHGEAEVRALEFRRSVARQRQEVRLAAQAVAVTGAGAACKHKRGKVQSVLTGLWIRIGFNVDPDPDPDPGFL